VAQVLTTCLEVLAIVLVVAGAVAVVVGVSAVSVPAAFIVGGLEAAALGVGGLWVSKRVSR
jgi:hypothetical protein